MKKTALITGSSRGIGAAIAQEFAKEGYHLVLCCRLSGEKLNQLAQNLRNQYHIDVLTFIGDIGDYTFVQDMISSALAHFESIEVLINNAGISHIGLLADMSIEDWNRLVSVNLTSVFSTCQCLIPSMVSHKRGKIINISSVWGNVGASCETAYSACKGGMNAFTRALGKELAPSNIQVNAISCGIIDTDMNGCFTKDELSELIEDIPSGRMGRPCEVAQLALALASGHDYLTGQIITLDGGWI